MTTLQHQHLENHMAAAVHECDPHDAPTEPDAKVDDRTRAMNELGSMLLTDAMLVRRSIPGTTYANVELRIEATARDGSETAYKPMLLLLVKHPALPESYIAQGYCGLLPLLEKAQKRVRDAVEFEAYKALRT